MKKIISSLIALSLIIMQIPAFAISGTGTEANPYLVSSVSDVLAMHNDLDGYYKLTANVDMNGVAFEPIGNENKGTFTGTIDGNGYTISNLNINLPDNKYVGFVGCLEGTVKDLNISNVDAYGYRYVGGIVGYAGEDAVIDNCTASGSISGEYQISDLNIGGIVGYSYGTVSDCDNYCVVNYDGSKSSVYVGGIAGYNNTGNVSNCSNSGNIMGYNYAGGITSYNYCGTITNCINSGSIDSSDISGGIVGGDKEGSVNDCSNLGNVIAYESGGIVGHSYKGAINSCNNMGNITSNMGYYISGEPKAGGITGYCSTGTIANCNSNGIIDGGKYSGGVLGCSESCKVSNCINRASITSSYAGGITGYKGYIYNCVNLGVLNGSYTYEFGYMCGVSYITLSACSVQSGESVMMPIKLYGYDRELTWISSDNSIATVNSKGIVTGVKCGSATITATTELGISTSAIITVTSTSSSISLNKSNITLQEGYTDKITATLTPSDATDTITWTSSNESVATVSDGVVTAISVGNATITATTSSGRIAYCAVTVTSPTVSVNSVTLNKSELTLTQADTVQLSASVLPSDATNKTLSWSTSDENVATVSDMGVVTAVSSGIAVITAAANNGMYDSCVVKVVSASGPSVVLSDANISVGGQTRVKANILKNPGISAYKFTIKYDDSILTPVAITPNDAFGGTFTTNLDDADRDVLNVLWYADEDTDMSGELFTVDFELNDGLISGSSAVSLEYGDKDICNSAGDSVALYIADATITVAEPLNGDVYEDGDVTVYDLTLLSRYVTGLEKLTARQLEAGDVNNDGGVDIKDVVKLAQYIVGWSGVELMSADDNIADIKIGTAAVDENGEAYIPVLIENNSGIAGFRFNINYNPDEVEILEIIPNTDILPEHLQTNLGQEDENGLLVTWYQEGDMNLNGELFKIKVRYTGDTASKISIKEADNNMCNQSLENVLGNYTEGFVLGSKCVVTEKETGVVEIYSNTAYKDKSATIIAAQYNENGVLLECKTQSLILTGGKQEVTFEGFNGNDIRYFLWDSLYGMAPLTSK